MVFNEFITLEKALGSLLPMNIGGIDFIPQFMYGTHADMLVYLNQKRKSGESIYPLIWLITPFSLEGVPFANGDVDIILATLTTSNLSNNERVRVTFQTTLDPLLDIVIQAINKEYGLSIVEEEYRKVTKHFNYDTENKTESSDIWDVIQFKTTIQFNLKCI